MIKLIYLRILNKITFRENVRPSSAIRRELDCDPARIERIDEGASGFHLVDRRAGLRCRARHDFGAEVARRSRAAHHHSVGLALVPAILAPARSPSARVRSRGAVRLDARVIQGLPLGNGHRRRLCQRAAQQSGRSAGERTAKTLCAKHRGTVLINWRTKDTLDDQPFCASFSEMRPFLPWLLPFSDERLPSVLRLVLFRCRVSRINVCTFKFNQTIDTQRKVIILAIQYFVCASYWQ